MEGFFKGSLNFFSIGGALNAGLVCDWWVLDRWRVCAIFITLVICRE
jgi:hypothetical protein